MKLQTIEYNGNNINLDKLRDTFEDGGFFLKLDQPLMCDVVDIYKKASNMRKSDLIQFHKGRENYQVRQIFIDDNDVNFGEMGKLLNKIAINILFSALDALCISKDYQNKLFSGFGNEYFNNKFSMNLYQNSGESDGVYLHQDFTYVTVLYPDPKVPGLADADDNDIRVPESCLLVNYGETLELLTNHKINALWHKVKKVEEDRLSMILFLTGPYKEGTENDLSNVPFLVAKHNGNTFEIGSSDEYPLYKNFHESKLNQYYEKKNITELEENKLLSKG